MKQLEIKVGKYTYHLCDQPNRPKEMPQPNFLGTGYALQKISINEQKEQK